jgi:hypothetical protein
MTEFNVSAATTDYQREIMGQWETDGRQLYELAQRYHERCDFFDKIWCPSTQGQPRTGVELRLVNRHARQVLNELCDEAIELDITKDELIREIRRQAR